MSAWWLSFSVEWALALLLELSLLAALLYASYRRPHPGSPRVERALLIIVFLPLLYATAVWSGALNDDLLRFKRQWAAGIATVAGAFALYRLRAHDEASGAPQLAVRNALLVSSALALGLGTAGLEVGRALNRMSIIVLVDQSRSIHLVDQAETRISRELAVAEFGMAPHDRIAVLGFGSNAQIEMPLRRREQPNSAQRASIGRDSTDIEQAIRQGLVELPGDARGKLVLISDGVATRGDTFESVAAALAAEVPIDVLPLEQQTLENVRLVSVTGPAAVSEGETFDLRVVIESPVPQELELRVLTGDTLSRSGRLQVGSGQEVVHLRQQAGPPGMRRYQVQLSATRPELDQLRSDNQRSTFVKIRGPTTALILSKDPAQNAPLEAALRSAAMVVTNVEFSDAPLGVLELTGFDLVVLGDLPAHVFTEAQLDAFAAQVRALGGGLLLLGSDQSMGPGGYSKTTIEDVSPVSFDLKQDRRRGRLAQVIAIDYSGSMGARAGDSSKLSLANEAAVRSLQLLAAGDRVGVMHVDTAVRWTIPLGAVENKSKLSRLLRGVSSGGGGIFIDLALRSAYERLRKEDTNLKHLLLFADGSDAEDRGDAPKLVQSALTQGITTSVVALGQGPDIRDLESFSQLGAGRFYLIEDAQRLPAVFAQETILAARAALSNRSFTPTATSNLGPLRGLQFSAAPPLYGYVVTLPKSRAEILLKGPEQDPILASWSVGLGHAAAFTSDYSGRWGRSWTTWPGAAQLFAQLGRSLARGADDPNFRLKADARGGQIRVEADVISTGGFADSYRKLAVNIVGPDGSEHPIPLNPSAPGRYDASMPLDRPGVYLVSARDIATNALLGVTGAELHPADELKPTGTDFGVLSRIARETGGSVRSSLDGLFRERLGRRFGYLDISSALLWLGATLLILSVLARRYRPPTAVRAYWLAIRQVLRPRNRSSADPPSIAQPPVAQRLENASTIAQPARRSLQSAPFPDPPHATARAGLPQARPPTAAQVLLERRRKRGQKT